MQQTTHHDKLLTMREAAAQIGVTPKTIYNWIRAGKLDHFKLGRTVRIPPEAIVQHYQRKGAA